MKPSTQQNKIALIKQGLETRKKALIEIGNRSTNAEEVAIIKAQLDTPIKYFDYSTASNKKKIISVLTEWAYNVGAAENSTDASTEAQIYNAKFIITNFGDMTLLEIKQAIQWSVLGKLDIDANCFGKLTPIYIARILNKYIDKRNAITRMLQVRNSEANAIKKHADEYQNKPYEEKVIEFREALIRYMTDMKKNRMEDVAGNLVWKFLTNAGKVNEGMFNGAAREYANQKLQEFKLNERTKGLNKIMSPDKRFDKDEYHLIRYMKDYIIYMVLEKINDISAFVNSQPNEIILAKT